MRILVCHPGPHFSVHDVYAGWVEALRDLGHDVIEFNLSDRLTFYQHALFQIQEGIMRPALTPERAVELAVNGLYAALYKTRPEIMLAISGFFLTPELLDLVRWSRTKVVLVHTESPYEDSRQLTLAPHADINLVNDYISLPKYEALSESHYVPHCYRPSLHKPGKPVGKLACDLSFVGTGYPSRTAFFEEMDLTGLDVFLAGNWPHLNDDSPLLKFLAHEKDECLDNWQTVQVYQSSKVGINLYRDEGEPGGTGWAMGPREVEMAACGLFYLRDPRLEGNELLPMLPTFNSPEEASDLVHAYLARPVDRQRIADKARAAVADRTFGNQAARLLRLLDKQPVTA